MKLSTPIKADHPPPWWCSWLLRWPTLCRWIVVIIESPSCVRLFETPWIIAKALLSMGLPRQEYWSGLHFLLQEIFPNQDQTHVSCFGRQILYHWAIREALVDCASPWAYLLLLYYVLLLNSFLCKVKKAHLVAIPGTCLKIGVWPSSPAPLSFLHKISWLKRRAILSSHFFPPMMSLVETKFSMVLVLSSFSANHFTICSSVSHETVKEKCY